METELKRNDDFIKHIFLKYAVSSVLAMLATSVSGMIDTVIVGHFLGEIGLSAMSLVGPVYLLYYTIGAVIGMGGSIVANLAIGRNDYDSYRRVYSLSLVVTVILAVVVTLLGLAFLPQLVTLFGGEGIIGEYMTDYLRWYILLGGFTLLVYIPLYFLKTEGKPQASSYLFLITGGLNVVLSWLFMSPVCGMGMKGASIATGIAMGVTTIIGFYVMLKDSRELRFVRFSFRQLREVLLCGSPNGCNNLFNALKLFAINGALIGIGAASYLPSAALIKSVSDLITGVIVGVSTALMPIVGVLYSEKDWDSIRRVCKRALKASAVIAVLLMIAVGCFPGLWCALFNVTETYAREGARSGLGCLAISFLAATLNLMLTGYFNSIKRPGLSNMILALRMLVFLIPSAFLLGRGLGVRGVWGSMIVAEFFSLVTVFVVMGIIRKRNPALDRYLLNTTNEGKGDISFSVKNTVDDIVDASTRITDFCEKNEIDASKSMFVSLALEEMLTVIITYCMDNSKEHFIDIRIVDLGEDVLIRIRNTGKIFDPVRFYEENKDNEDMMEEVLGVRMIANSAKEVTFHETFGTNNLMVIL